MNIQKENINYPSLDIMKFLMALLIMLSHTQSEYALDGSILLHYFLATSNIGVPFFFACSGFLFFTKIKQMSSSEQLEYYRKWSVRIGKMYLCWSVIYFMFILYNWITKGTSSEAILSYIHKCIVSSTYPTIWFLPALWVGVSIAFVLYRKQIKSSYILLFAILMYAICALGDSYSNPICQNQYVNSIWHWYDKSFITYRNGLFEGFPFATLGLLLTDYSRNTKWFSKNLALALFFCFMFVGESFLIRMLNLSPNTHSGFMLFPATFFVIRILLDINMSSRSVYLELRNLSMIIFLSQRLFLTAIPSVSTSYLTFVDSLDPYTTILFLDGMIIIFSITMKVLSKRYKTLKVLF